MSRASKPHNRKKIVRCTICFKVYPNKDELYKHRTKHIRIEDFRSYSNFINEWTIK